MRKLTLFIYLVTQILLVNNSYAQTNTITSFDEFMNLANAKSMTIKSGDILVANLDESKEKINFIFKGAGKETKEGSEV